MLPVSLGFLRVYVHTGYFIDYHRKEDSIKGRPINTFELQTGKVQLLFAMIFSYDLEK
jgi:hypothetical protein